MTLAWFCKKAHSSAAIAPFGVHPSQPGTSCCHGLFCLAKDRFRSWAANPCAPLSREAGSPPLNVDRRGLYLWQRRRGMQSHQGLQTPLSLWLQSGRGSSIRSPVVRNILDNVAASHALNWCIQKENQLQGREIWRCPVYLERKRFFVLSMWGGLTINRRNKSLGKFREKRLKSCPGPLFFQYASKQRAQISRRAPCFPSTTRQRSLQHLGQATMCLAIFLMCSWRMIGRWDCKQESNEALEKSQVVEKFWLIAKHLQVYHAVTRLSMVWGKRVWFAPKSTLACCGCLRAQTKTAPLIEPPQNVRVSVRYSSKETSTA